MDLSDLEHLRDIEEAAGWRTPRPKPLTERELLVADFKAGRIRPSVFYREARKLDRIEERAVELAWRLAKKRRYLCVYCDTNRCNKAPTPICSTLEIRQGLINNFQPWPDALWGKDSELCIRIKKQVWRVGKFAVLEPKAKTPAKAPKHPPGIRDYAGADMLRYQPPPEATALVEVVRMLRLLALQTLSPLEQLAESQCPELPEPVEPFPENGYHHFDKEKFLGQAILGYRSPR